VTNLLTRAQLSVTRLENYFEVTFVPP
jgi:hypothetical protein